jgi:hypothetical protein
VNRKIKEVEGFQQDVALLKCAMAMLTLRVNRANAGDLLQTIM